MSTEDGIPLFPLLRGADSLAVSAQAGEMVQQLLVLAALELAVYGCTVQIFRRVLRPMKEGRPFDGAARQLRRLA